MHKNSDSKMNNTSLDKTEYALRKKCSENKANKIVSIFTYWKAEKDFCHLNGIDQEAKAVFNILSSLGTLTRHKIVKAF